MLPEVWEADAFIAGGFAASSNLACDIDVWVTVPVGMNLAEIRQELLLHLADSAYRVMPDASRESSDDVEVDAYGTHLDVLKVAYVQAPGFKPVHLMVVNGEPLDVLANFDISTHQVAITPRDGTVRGPQWTSVMALPIKLKDTPTTPARMEKLTRRYAPYRLALIPA